MPPENRVKINMVLRTTTMPYYTLRFLGWLLGPPLHLTKKPIPPSLRINIMMLEWPITRPDYCNMVLGSICNYKQSPASESQCLHRKMKFETLIRFFLNLTCFSSFLNYFCMQMFICLKPNSGNNKNKPNERLAWRTASVNW